MIINENTKNVFDEDFNQIKKDSILNEQYYGSNKYTDELDALFQEALDLTKTEREATKLTTIGIGANINIKKISSIEKRIEKLIKEWFNFSEVQFTFEPFISINASAVCIVFRDSLFAVDPKYNKIVNKYGIRYEKPQRHAVLKMATEFLTVTGITNKVLTGLLLHEIGHNFYEEVSVTKYITEIINGFAVIQGISKTVTSIIKLDASKQDPTELIKLLYDAVNELSLYVSSMHIIGAKYAKFLNYIESTPLNTFFKISKFQIKLYQTIKKTAESMDIFFGILTGKYIRSYFPKEKLIKTALNTTLLRTQYRNELFADNFATAYGYGKYILEAQRLFINDDTDLARSFINHFKLLALIQDVMDAPNALFMGFDDVHPDNVARMIDQISYLEDNLKLESNKDKRKAIAKDLASVKDIYKKFQSDLELDGDIPRRGKLLTALLLKMNVKTKGQVAYKIDKYTNKQRIDGVWKALV